MKDPMAIYSLGCKYDHGSYGCPQDHAKALELYHRAAELGLISAYYNIGCAYYNGNGVGRDKEKATHYFELAAIKGDSGARHALGIFEKQKGNMDRALKHFMIAVSEDASSLGEIKQLFINGHAKKEDYAKALRSSQAFLEEIRSEQRDKIAAFNANWKCY